MISMADGEHAVRDDVAHRRARLRRRVSNAASSVWTHSGRLTIRSVTFVATPSVPSDPTNTPLRS